MPHSRARPLSIVVATHRSWPGIQRCLEALHQQAAEVGAEILLTASSADALPESVAGNYPAVVCLESPGASSYHLRAQAIARAEGEIIAITEDHCRVRPNWCRAILAAHQAEPSAAAIGGAVENGTGEHLLDWAGFLIANGPCVSPLVNGESDCIALQANVSYKRRTIEAYPIPRLGFMEMLYNQQLREHGARLVADDRIVVEHDQSLAFGVTCALHFHNGRCIAGFRLERIGLVERVLRLAGCVMLPPVMLWRTLATVIGKRRLVDRALLATPWIVCLLLCHAAGEWVGYLTGPGRSGAYRHIG